MKRFYGLFFILTLISLFVNASLARAGEKPLIIASTTDVASITKFITGQDYGEVLSIMNPGEDPNFVTPSQNVVFRAKDAELLFKIGIDLEKKWEKYFHDQAGNTEIAIGSSNNMPVSSGIKLLPTKSDDGKATPLIHTNGNPYVWLDPMNGKAIASNITDILSSAYPKHARNYQRNLDKFNKAIDESLPRWEKTMKPLKGKKIIACQHTFDYFAKRFGLDIIGYIEPAPGVPVTSKRAEEFISFIKENKPDMLIITDYNSRFIPEDIAKKTGVNLVILPASVGKEWDDYIKLFNHLTLSFANSLAKDKEEPENKPANKQ